MKVLSILYHMTGEVMKDDYEYFTESVGEQLFLILMTAVSTMTVVGIILAIAL